MGKGDKRSRRGKIFAGSYGKTRPKHKKKAAAAESSAEPKSNKAKKA
jgi:30S ribosomal protein S31